MLRSSGCQYRRLLFRCGSFSSSEFRVPSYSVQPATLNFELDPQGLCSSHSLAVRFDGWKEPFNDAKHESHCTWRPTPIPLDISGGTDHTGDAYKRKRI